MITSVGVRPSLRHQGELFGPVASDTIAWRTVAGCDGVVLARISKARAKARLPETAWTPALDAGGAPRPDAQVAELTGLLRHSAGGDRLAGWRRTCGS